MLMPSAAAQPLRLSLNRSRTGASLQHWRRAACRAGRQVLAATLTGCLLGTALAQTALPGTGLPAISSGMSPGSQPGATLTRQQKRHERELQAIRQALLESTLQGPTRVMSAAWIDANGTLRELAHFNSESRVEGVRVLGYVQDDEDGEPLIGAEVLPWGWPRQDGASCAQAPRQWRQPLQLHSQLEAGLSGPQQWLAQTLLQGAMARWQHTLEASPRWQAHHARLPVTNTYEQVLTGTGQGKGSWGLTLSLGLAPDQVWQSLDPVQRYQHRGQWAFRLSLQMHELAGNPAHTGTQALHMSQDFWVDPQRLVGPTARSEAQALLTRLQARLDQWAERMHAHFECEPMRYTVEHEGGRKLLLQAGQGSGLRPGDRVLVIDPARIPSQILEPSALAHLALAEVVRVNRHQTELQQLAGPALPAASTWVALPL